MNQVEVILPWQHIFSNFSQPQVPGNGSLFAPEFVCHPLDELLFVKGTSASVGQKARQGRYQRVSSIKSDPDYASDAQNDSDSAIMLEDHMGEVSLSVPNLRAINGSSGENQFPLSFIISTSSSILITSEPAF